MFQASISQNGALMLAVLLASACSAAPNASQNTVQVASGAPASLRRPTEPVAALAPVSQARSAAPLLSTEFVLDVVWDEQATAGPRAEPNELWLLARFRIPPGHHLYWENPGESGLETQVKFQGPPAYEISKPMYPGPARFTSERGSTSYGYSGEIAILAKAQRLESSPTSFPAQFRAEASWLSCSDVCVKEQAASARSLGEHPPGGWAPLEVLRERLPRPLESGQITARRVSETKLQFSAKGELELLEYFPRTRDGSAHGDVTHLRDASSKNLGVVHTASMTTFDGVLAAEVSGMRRWFTALVP